MTGKRKRYSADFKAKVALTAGLTALRRELERMVAGRAHSKVAECRVIGILAGPGECQHHDCAP